MPGPLFSLPTLEAVGAKRSVRLACAVGLVALHLIVVNVFGRSAGLRFNQAPGEPPYYTNPMVEGIPYLWDRILVSRWDSCHYIALSLRGYSTCTPRPVPPNFLENAGQCQLSFFPGYPAIGWLFSLGNRLPIDWTLLVVSLVASVAFLYLWTHDAMQRALGTAGCYLSLLAFNVFPPAFALVTIQTEPVVLAATLGCFIALQTRHLTWAALLSGLATGIRITAVGIPVAYALALFGVLWVERRKVTPTLVLSTFGRLALSAWGVALMMAVHQWRFNDPLVYLHSHARAFQHEASLSSVFLPEPELLHRAIAQPEHEGVWVGAAMLWLALGLRKGIAGFQLPGKLFWIGLTISTLGIAMPGSVGLAYAGMNRYLLLVLPLFFSIAAIGRRHAAAFLLWTAISGWNYYNFTLRIYLMQSPLVTHFTPSLQLPPRVPTQPVLTVPVVPPAP